jgi:general secretion pathway protein D
MSRTNPIYLACALAALLWLSGCASPAIEEAARLSQQGQHEAAVARLQQALSESPDDRKLRVALLQQQDDSLQSLNQQAMVAAAGGQQDAVAAVLKRMEAVAPQHPRTTDWRLQVDRNKRLARMMAGAQKDFDAKAYDAAEVSLRALLSEDVGNQAARQLLAHIDDLRARQTRQQTTMQLATSQSPITLEFREAPLKNVFEALARSAGINFVFDKDVRGDAKVTLFLKNTTVDEAMRVILSTQQLGSKLLNDNTVMVFPATQQKQRELLDTVTRTFYLTNTDTKQAQQLIRTVAKTRDVFADERLNLLVVRDTPEVMRLIERLIEGLDLPDPEVMLDLEVMEVSSRKLSQIGLSWPDTVNFGVPGGTGPVTLSTPLSDSLHFYVTNPMAIATLKSSKGASNLLANPKIRARNREKAKVLLGEKLPIFTTTSTANVGVSASVNYLEVGLKLEIEPQVQLDNDVTIKVALEVSTITDKVTGPQGSLAYQVGTRQASTTLRLKDGETQILAGLINDNESRSASGIPGLHDLPIAGRLFGTTTDSKDKTEIVLLVTPRIIRNIVQPAGSVSHMPSGTEAQPGAASTRLRDGAGASGVAMPTDGSRLSAGSLPGAARALAGTATRGVSLGGPEEVMPGAAFQVTVRNPTNQPYSGTLSFDASYLELSATPNGGGFVSIQLPPGGFQSVMLRAKPGVKMADTQISLDGAEALPIRVRDAATPEPPPQEVPANENDQR